MLTRYLRLPIFMQIFNDHHLQFQGKRFESNLLASAYVKRVMFVGIAEMTQMDYTNRNVVKGWQYMSRECFEMKRVAVSPIAFGEVCSHVCTCVHVRECGVCVFVV